MAFVSHQYNYVNKAQINDANQLIEILSRQNPDEIFDLIVDIGSGSGNVTKQLSNRIRHKKIIALDIDHNMTEFAQQNYSSDTIEYMTEDVSKPWDQLDTTLKRLEGRVSLVFSNRVLHWVDDKETAAKNISRLLAKNGQIHINITAIFDVTQNLSKELEENFMKFPSIDEQLEIWVKLFTDAGIELKSGRVNYSDCFCDRNIFAGIFPALPKLYKIYLKNKNPEFREIFTDNSEFKSAVFDKWFLGRDQEFKPNVYKEFLESDKSGVNVSYCQLRFIGNKK